MNLDAVEPPSEFATAGSSWPFLIGSQLRFIFVEVL